MSTTPTNFIRNIISDDKEQGRLPGKVITRFPPEPNGYLHIGHAKSICLNFGVAADFGGVCHLRMDDTNPEKESMEYVESIIDSVRWLGFDWQEKLFFASDYYERLYRFATDLIRQGKAFVCSLPPDEVRELRGTLTEPGRPSPYRERSVEENLDLFARMRAGEFPDGSHTLRAKIDMASPNMNLRDPVIYRIQRVPHYRTGMDWCIYPMYDFAHPLSDALEGITHSLCTLEFEDHRPLYDWFIDNLEVPCTPRQIEFARLNLSYTVMSKRKLLELVREGHVSGWDDPRMPTLVGMRRRGYPAGAIRRFCDMIGVGKSESTIDVGVLEECVRDELNAEAPRTMGVLQPLKLVIENYPEDRVEQLEAPNHPQQPEMGSRTIPFCREIYIERDDFLEEPPRKFFRLGPGREVRLRYGYIVKCNEVIKDPDTGEVVELRCSYDPETLGANPKDGRKVKGIIHWVSARHALEAQVRLYDRLFEAENPTGDKDRDYREFLNPDSLTILEGCRVEPGLGDTAPGRVFQFERQGYFCRDEGETEMPVFNRTASLRDSWSKG